MTDSNNILTGGRRNRDPNTISTSLLCGLKAGDEDKWSRLSRLYTPLVYYWCIQGGLQPEDAADVVQEVFRTVVIKVDRFRRDREGDTFRGWLRTITRNKLGDYYRQCKRRQRASGGTDAYEHLAQIPAHETADSSDQVVQVEAALLYRRVFEVIRCEFEEQSWQAFFKVAVDGLKPKDAATDLGISVNAVYLAKSRIMRRVREELGEVADEV